MAAAFLINTISLDHHLVTKKVQEVDYRWIKSLFFLIMRLMGCREGYCSHLKAPGLISSLIATSQLLRPEATYL